MVKVLMVLARSPQHPEGHLDDRLHFDATLTPQGQLDADAWETGDEPWLTARDRPGHSRRVGELVKIDDGWALRSLGSEDEPLYRFTAGVIRPGELVSVDRLDGEDMLYRIVAVDPG